MDRGRVPGAPLDPPLTSYQKLNGNVVNLESMVSVHLTSSRKAFWDVDHTWRAVLHGDCITVYLHKTPAYPNPGTMPVT